VAYKTEIQIGVKGTTQLDKLRQQVTSLNKKVNEIDASFGRGVQSVKRYEETLQKAADTLRKAKMATDDEQRAVKQYVTALNNANAAQQRQNNLIQQEITRRGQATQALRAYNAELAKPRQPGSMAGSYLRPQQARGTTQFPGPIGPGPASQIPFGPIGGPSSSVLGGQSMPVDERISRALQQKRDEARLQQALLSLEQKSAQVENDKLIARKELARISAEEIKRVKFTAFQGPIGPGPASSIGGGPKPPGRTGLQKFADFGLGAGFPLLFGGGAGQVLGGTLGTLLGGGGPAGFGLQIALSAIGGQLEDALRRIQEIDRATQNLDMDALAQSAIVVNAELRETVQNLVDMGENQRAVEVAAAAVSMQTGVLPESVSDASNAVTLLSNVWDELVGRVSGLLSLVGTPLVSALTLVLKLVSEGVRGINFFVNLIGLAIKRFVELIRFIPGGEKLLQGMADAMGGVDEAAESRLVTLRQTGTELEKELGREKEIFAIEQRRVAGNTAAAKLTNAQADRDEALARLRIATEKKITDERRKFADVQGHSAKVEREYNEVLIRGQAEIEKQRILKKFSLDEEAAGIQRAKELAKQQAQETKQALDNQKQALQNNLAILQNTLAIEQERNNLAISRISLDQTLSNIRLKDFEFIKAAREAGLSELEQLKLMGLERLNSLNIEERLALVRKGGAAIAREEEEILKKQFTDKLKAAKLEYDSQLLSIDASVSKAKIEQQITQIQSQQLQVQVTSLKIQAQAIENAEERAAALARANREQALVNQQTAEIERLARNNLSTAIRQADIQRQIAGNKYEELKATIQSEELERRRSKVLSEIEARSARIAQNTKAAAEASNQISSTAGGSGGGGLGSTTTQTLSTSMPIDPDVRKAVMDRAPALTGYRSTYELIEKLEEAQKFKNARAARAAQLAQMSQPSSSSFASSSSYAPRSSSGSSSGTTSVNISTGPVLEFDGKRYMTMDDFEKGVAKLAGAQAQRARSYGSRRYGGIS